MSTNNDELEQSLSDTEDNNASTIRRLRASRNARRNDMAPFAMSATAPTSPNQPSHAPSSPAKEVSSPKANKKVANESAEDDRISDDEPMTQHRWGIVRFFTDDRTRLFLASVLLIASVFLIYAIATFFKAGAHDQSVVLNTPLSEIAQDPASVHNGAGGVGAWVSQVLICDWLGMGSLVFIVYFWILALALLKIRKCNFWSITFKTLLLAISISIVVGFFTYESGTMTRWGGSHGHYVNQLMISYTTEFGALLLSIFLILLVVCVYFNELKGIWDKWQQVRYNSKMRAQLARAQAEKNGKLDNPVHPDALADTSADENVESDVKDSTADEDQIANDAPTADTQGEAQKDTEPLQMDVPDDTDTVENLPFVIVDDTGREYEDFVIDDGDDDDNDNDHDNDHADDDGDDNDHDNDDDNDNDNDHGDGDEEGETFSVVVNEIETADKPNKIDRTPMEQGPYDHRAELAKYKFPDVALLQDHGTRKEVDMDEQEANKDRIIKTLLDYKIPISSIEATVGPTVTLYEIVPAQGVRISSIKNLEDDIALSLSALGIRIIAPIPGRGTIGIEVPNADPQTVSMKSVITSKKFQECKMALPMAMGATVSNEIFIADLAKMPHMLVAGATGMGKSVGLNAIIASLLYKKHPSELKFVLVDPKMVEFSLYSKLERHYMAKLPAEDDAIITDPNKVIQTLNSLCVEMDNRYALLKEAGVRTVEEYNKKFTERRLNPEKGHFYMPYIVIIVDEFADLIMMAGKEVENPIARIAQKARAVGMHMIIATQRPSTNVITGLIKANFPGRIAFRVAQMVDSKTILDRTGANQLIGRGDMLFSHNGSMERVQCAFISTEEVEEITEWINNQVGYQQAYALPDYLPEQADAPIAGASSDRDQLFDEAARFVVSRQNGSTSSLQRQFNVGYNRAGRLMDQMEAAGIVGPANGAKPRVILVDSVTLEAILSQR